MDSIIYISGNVNLNIWTSMSALCNTRNSDMMKNNIGTNHPMLQIWTTAYTHLFRRPMKHGKHSMKSPLNEFGITRMKVKAMNNIHFKHKASALSCTSFLADGKSLVSRCSGMKFGMHICILIIHWKLIHLLNPDICIYRWGGNLQNKL